MNKPPYVRCSSCLRNFASVRDYGAHITWQASEDYDSYDHRVPVRVPVYTTGCAHMSQEDGTPNARWWMDDYGVWHHKRLRG